MDIIDREVTVVHRSVKHTRLRVSSDGSIRLVVPKQFSIPEIQSLLSKKADWIKRQREFFQTHVRSAQRLGPDEVTLFGEIYRWVVRPDSYETVDVDKEARIIRVGSQFRESKSRRRWLRNFAGQYLRERVEQLSLKHGFQYVRCFVRSQRTRWGSCSKKKNVSLNWRVVAAPKYAIDYVILHELVHTKVLNHSQRFWIELRAICPQHSKALDWLRSHLPEDVI